MKSSAQNPHFSDLPESLPMRLPKSERVPPLKELILGRRSTRNPSGYCMGQRLSALTN